ncbi:MAG: bifunctional folylpolyglutamate synthase/dihydrofolate synthase [Chloroflexi bacterium]|nr:bifunctional folylpolyglutamate synthase/dihydrofolate synthase [Chloroflexota bacterium]MYF22504.1 bifunctional folylpolyglutamate synthase/dihydrofolate synthase [Chloroflexota bacterium]
MALTDQVGPEPVAYDEANDMHRSGRSAGDRQMGSTTGSDPLIGEPIGSHVQAVDWLMSFADFERGSGPRRAKGDFALDRIRSILRRLGNPQHGRTTIHVAGSKGKGSTAAMLESILRAAGFRTGLFTSPHLHDFAERIRIQGEPLSEQEFARLAEQIRHVIEAELADDAGHISTFEILTALSFHAFHAHDVDVQIVEVGLGGRLDSTNVFSSTDAAVITSLSYEHTDILGDKITQIAAEKAGIISAGCRSVILAPQRYREATDVVLNAADDVPVPLVNVGEAYESEPAGVEPWGQWFRLRRLQPRPGEQPQAMHLLPLLGRHQIDNALTAIATIDALVASGSVAVPSEALHKGLATVRWPARLESFELPEALATNDPGGPPRVVLDGAHNAESIQRALDACREYFPHRQLHVVFGVLGDKALLDMARLIQSRSVHVYTTTSNHPRARSPQQVADAFDDSEWKGALSAHADPQLALEAAGQLAQASDLILVLGSLSLAADARRLLSDPPEAAVARRAEDPTV